MNHGIGTWCQTCNGASGFHVFPRRVSCFPWLGVSCFPLAAFSKVPRVAFGIEPNGPVTSNHAATQCVSAPHGGLGHRQYDALHAVADVLHVFGSVLVTLLVVVLAPRRNPMELW